MKKLYLILFLFISQNMSAQWEYRGLISTNVSNLIITGDTIYASTYDGIYKQPALTPADTTWIPCGMQGQHVVQTLVPDPLTFICLVEIGSSLQTQLYKSVDGGNSFNLLTTDTSKVNQYPFLEAMTHPGGNYDTLYLLNHNLRTFDGGITWDTINPQQLSNRFITVNPYNHDQLIIGGENFILSPSLQISYDHGMTWSMPAMNGYFAGDNSVHDLAFDASGNWYAAGEGVICVSSDSGNNWIQLNNSWGWSPNFALYNYAIENGTYGVYSTGANSSAMQVPFMIKSPANNFFDTLSTTPHDGMNPQIKSMAVLTAPFIDYIFFGGHGVYLYGLLGLGIDEHENNSIASYPNPFNDAFIVELKPDQINYSFLLLDAIGRNVANGKLNPGLNKINPGGLSPGIYFLQIMDHSVNAVKRFQKIKL